MRIRLSALLVVLCAIAGSCAPKDKCNGTLYYDPVNVSCRACPKDSTFKNGTCQCKDSYEFVNNACVLMDGAMIDVPDSGSGAPAASNCMEYCTFAKSCLGDNALATSALPDVVSGLHADDTGMCMSSCTSDLGGDGSTDPVVACIKSGQVTSPCAGDSSQTGLVNALTVIGDCCKPHQDNALCKSICKPLKANALTSTMIDFCM